MSLGGGAGPGTSALPPGAASRAGGAQLVNVSTETDAAPTGKSVWVAEMYGYALGAAKLGLRHRGVNNTNHHPPGDPILRAAPGRSRGGLCRGTLLSRRRCRRVQNLCICLQSVNAKLYQSGLRNPFVCPGVSVRRSTSSAPWVWPVHSASACNQH